MFKALLLQSWHSLSDPKLEEALRVRIDFMLFPGMGIENELKMRCQMKQLYVDFVIN